jgi:ZIP family zinc transporter
MVLLEAALLTLAATSTLIIGTWIAFTFRLSPKVVGIVLGFGAGALIAAVAYEMFPETSRDLPAFLFLALGALVFYAGTVRIEGRPGTEGSEGASAEAQGGKTIVLGSLLDCIPECLVLGMGVAIGGGTVSIALFVSMLVATLPLAIGASSLMERGGMTHRRIYTIWLLVILVCVFSAMGGAALIQLVPQLTGTYVMAAAAGALLAMLAVSMVPEALRETGVLAGLMIVFGFAFAAMLGVL